MKMKVEKLYPKQQNLIETLSSLYKKHDKDQRLFLEMPTGSGKTLTALFSSLKELSGENATIAWAVHQKQLVQQAYEELCEIIGVTPQQGLHKPSVKYQNLTFTFMTWQAMRATSTRYDLLIVDECHRGSSQPGTYMEGKNAVSEHTSFKKILKLSDKHLYVSATPWNLDQDVFPGLLTPKGKPKDDRVALYTMQAARLDGALAQLQFKSIRTADTVKLQKLYHESSPEEIIDFEDEDAFEAAQILAEKKVDPKDDRTIKALEQSTLESVLEVFFREEGKNGVIPPTIVFCRTRANGTSGPLTQSNVCKSIKKAALKHFTNPILGRKFVDYVNSSDDSSTEAQDKLKKFQEGKINILCVVSMAQEGFNYKALECAIDFSPSFTNARLAVQKMGRILRLHKDAAGNVVKDQGRYYYPDTIEKYIKLNSVKKEPGAGLDACVQEVLGAQYEHMSQEQLDHAKYDLMRQTQFMHATGDKELAPVMSSEEIELSHTMVSGQEQGLENPLGDGFKGKTTVTTAEYFVSHAESKIARIMSTKELFAGLVTVQGSVDPEASWGDFVESLVTGQGTGALLTVQNVEAVRKEFNSVKPRYRDDDDAEEKTEQVAAIVPDSVRLAMKRLSGQKV